MNKEPTDTLDGFDVPARSDSLPPIKPSIKILLGMAFGLYALGAPESMSGVERVLVVAYSGAAAGLFVKGAGEVFVSSSPGLGPMERPEGRPHDPPRGHRPAPLLREELAA